MTSEVADQSITGWEYEIENCDIAIGFVDGRVLTKTKVPK